MARNKNTQVKEVTVEAGAALEQAAEQFDAAGSAGHQSGTNTLPESIPPEAREYIPPEAKRLMFAIAAAVRELRFPSARTFALRNSVAIELEQSLAAVVRLVNS